jgi:hypothetical protein
VLRNNKKIVKHAMKKVGSPLVMLMIYLRTTSLRRKFSRFLTQIPDLFAGKMAEGLFLMKNTGKSMALILSEMQREGGNMDVYVCEPVRVEDLREDSELQRMASWLKGKKQARSILESETEENLPKEKAELLSQLTKKRFSVQWKIT